MSGLSKDFLQPGLTFAEKISIVGYTLTPLRAANQGNFATWYTSEDCGFGSTELDSVSRGGRAG